MRDTHKEAEIEINPDWMEHLEKGAKIGKSREAGKMKVYCKNCKWFVDVFCNTSTGSITSAHCDAPTGRILTDYIYGKYKERVDLHIWDTNYPNKKSSSRCKYYKRKWYKFWIKEDK